MFREVKVVSEDRPQTVLVFRWLIVLISILLMTFGPKGLRFTSPGYALAVFFFLSNVALTVLPRRLLQLTKFVTAVFAMDVVLLSLVIHFAGGAGKDLYLLYFFIIFVALLRSKSMTFAVTCAFLASMLYGAIAYRTSGQTELLTADFLIKIPFFSLIAVFGSIMSRQQAKLEHEKTETTRMCRELNRKLEKASKSKEKLYDEVLTLYEYNSSILDSLDCGVIVMDLEGKVTLFNRAAAEITGLKPDEMLFSQAEENSTLATFASLMKRSLTQPARREEMEIKTPWGKKKTIGISTYLLQHRKEQAGVIAIFADMEDIRKSQETSAFTDEEKPAAKPVDINAVLEDVVESLRADAERNGTSLELIRGKSVPLVSGNGGLLKKVFTNIIQNSLEAVQASDSVQVFSARDGEDVLVQVMDDGPGMVEEIARQVFDMFFTTKEKGRGLGLPVAMKIVRGHGGTIEFKSEAGKGTAFTVRLPGVASKSAETSISERGATVLVADDDPSVQSFYKRLLEDMGCAVLWAEDGQKAVKKAVSENIDLMILEMRIPVLDGIRIIEHLAKVKPDLPIVVCTDWVTMDSGYVLSNENVVECFSKPVNVFDLRRAIEKAVSTGSRSKVLSKKE
jgi:PAS domain S-box-containing protein